MEPAVICELPSEIYTLIARDNYGAYRSLVCANKMTHKAVYRSDWKAEYSLWYEIAVNKYANYEGEDVIDIEVNENTLTWWRIVVVGKSSVHIWRYNRTGSKYHIYMHQDYYNISSIIRYIWDGNTKYSYENINYNIKQIEHGAEWYEETSQFLLDKVIQIRKYNNVKVDKMIYRREWKTDAPWLVMHPYFIYHNT